DGHSLQILLREWSDRYAQLQTGQDAMGEELSIQYKDYVAWESTRFQSEEMKQQQAYWLEQFAAGQPSLELPIDATRPASQRFDGARRKGFVSSRQLQELEQICRQENSTLFTALLALVNVFIGRICNEKELVIGTPVSNRLHPQLDEQIGFYINTLALLSKRSAGNGFVQYLNELRQTLSGALQHSEYPFDQLVESLSIAPDRSRSPLFDIWVQYFDKNMQADTHFQLKGLQVEALELDSISSKFDLAFYFTETANGLDYSIEYNTRLFEESSIIRLQKYFERLLENILSHPEQDIEELALLEDSEIKGMISLAGGSRAKVPASTFPELFRKQALRTPQNEALRCGDKSFTYAQLDALTDRLSEEIRAIYPVQAEAPIGLMIRRSEWYVIGILSIQKAGGAFIPIDADLPEERIRYMMEASGSQLLLHAEVPSVPSLDCLQYELTYPKGKIKRNRRAARKTRGLLSNDSLSYILFTSGSTGRPKGAMIEHRGMLNHQYDKIYELNIMDRSRVAHTASVSFDISIWQALTALLVGACTVVYRRETVLDPQQLIEQINCDGISVMETVPSYLSSMIDVLERQAENERRLGLKYLLSIGEELKKKVAERWLALGLKSKLINAYGPTEAADTITHFCVDRLPKAGRIPVGRPIRNTRVYVLNDQLQLCPIGVKGEICVSGPGVGRGYINNEEQTQSNFLEDPFRKGVRLYRTGDLGCYTPNGNISFFGRKDHQLKIRGYRIELGEIEMALEALPAVSQSTAVVVDQQLWAFVVCSENADALSLRSQLAEQLPAYMIPDQWSFLESMPLNANGKTDRKALKALAKQTPLASEKILPRNNWETQLQQIWERILERKDIGIRDNFVQLGGHSLKAIKVMMAIQTEMNIRIDLQDIFQLPTIEALANKLAQMQVETSLDIPALPEQVCYELSDAQRRLWVINQFEESRSAHNMHMVCRLKGNLDKAQLAQAISHLVERHESLRTSFAMVDDRPMQFVQNETTSLALPCTDLRQESDPWARAEAIAIESAAKAFDLSQGPLFRFELLQVQEEEYLLVFVIHHIVSDGWSMEVIARELLQLYGQSMELLDGTLPSLDIQYKDFAAWQRANLSEGEWTAQQEFWYGQFQGEIPVLQLPTTFDRPAIKTYESKSIDWRIGDQLTQKINQLAQNEQSSVFNQLLASVFALMHRYSGQEDIVIGTPVAGREHPQLLGQVGCFLNTLALRTTVGTEQTFVELSKETSQALLAAHKHQQYPFDRLVNDLKLRRDSSRAPLFDVLVVSTDFQLIDPTVNLSPIPDLQANWWDIDRSANKYDLTFYFGERDGNIHLNLAYNT
ncbi:MAG: amino acid adenylation domain-containing protein, partial [Bacteroidota bacterium]